MTYNTYTPNATMLVALLLVTVAYALLCGMWLGFLLFVWTDAKDAPRRVD